MFIGITAATLFLLVVPGTMKASTETYHAQTSSLVISSEVSLGFADISQLAADYDFAKSEYWDGDTAAALSNRCINDVRALLKGNPARFIWPEVTPLVRGGLNLLWTINDVYIFLEVRNDRHAHLYYNVYGDKWEGVRPTNDPEIRQRLLATLLRLSVVGQFIPIKTQEFTPLSMDV
jgi:hypothetical protein